MQIAEKKKKEKYKKIKFVPKFWPWLIVLFN